MPSKPPPRNEPLYVWGSWLGIVGLYALLVGWRRSPIADVAVAAAALANIRKPIPMLAVATAALLGASGELPTLPALLVLVLLLLGPITFRALIAVAGLPVYLLGSSKHRLERTAAFVLIEQWLWRAGAVATTIAALVTSGFSTAALTVLGAVCAWGRRFPYAVLLLVGAAAIEGWPAAPLVLAGLCCVRLAWRLTVRPPKLWHPLPRPTVKTPLVWARCRSADGRIRRGDLLGARRSVSRLAQRSPHCAIRAVFLDLEERQFQSALALEQAPPESGVPDGVRLIAKLLRARAMSGVAQFSEAESLYATLADAAPREERFDVYLSTLRAENALAAGDTEAARDHAAKVLGESQEGRDYFVRLRAMCVVAECAISEEGSHREFAQLVEQLQSEMLADPWVVPALERNPAHLVRKLFGRYGSLHLYFVRVDALSRRGGELDDETGWDPDAVGLAMSVARWSDDLVELLLTEARRAAGRGKQATRLRLAIRALMELDVTRYQLAAQSTRTSWSRRLRRALDAALDAAYAEGERSLIAELLEFARVQGLPVATGEQADEFGLLPPPVVQLRGRSRLARPGNPYRPAPVALEDAAEGAAGRGAWWLSYWESDGWLYWSLIPPGAGEIEAGRTALGRRSALGRTLAELRAALPQLLPGESPPEADFRLASSPLLVDPSGELAMASSLGRDLLPESMKRAARRQPVSMRLPLAIAPSPSLGYVPWALLAYPGRQGRTERLLQSFDWTLAPSATLATHAVAASPALRAPLALSVADTVDLPELGALPDARAQAEALPRSVTVLGGPHWTSHLASVDAFAEKLRELGPDITAAFFCHAVRGTEAEPSRGGLVMGAVVSGGEAGPRGEPQSNGGLEVLGPHSIFAMGRDGTPMPAQVLLQACDTSALSDIGAGEWLTVAPAFLAGGSREVIATLYPTPDRAAEDDPLVSAALAGTSLSEALREMQERSLSAWEGRAPANATDAPIYWGAYAPVRRAQMRPVSPPGAFALVSRRFMRVLGRAIKESREGGGKQLHSGFLLSAVLEESGIAELLDGAGHSFRPWSFLWTLGPYICSRFLRITDGGERLQLSTDAMTVTVSATLVTAFRSAAASAHRDGILLEPEHFLRATLDDNSAARKILRLLSTVTRRRHALTDRALLHVLADAVADGQRAADPEAIGTSENERLAAAFVEFARAPTPCGSSARPDSTRI
ncbi:MAG TPA: CHAT domain-containing protein [Solirubrobacteraceae bacterium]|jgi:hypothetical protein